MTDQRLELLMLDPVMSRCGIYSPDTYQMTEEHCPDCDGEIRYGHNNDIALTSNYHRARCYLYFKNGTTIHCDGVMVGKY